MQSSEQLLVSQLSYLKIMHQYDAAIGFSHQGRKAMRCFDCVQLMDCVRGTLAIKVRPSCTTITATFSKEVFPRARGAHRLVIRAGEHVAPRGDQRSDRACVPSQGFQALQGLDVPNFDCAIIGPRKQPVVSSCQGSHSVCMTCMISNTTSVYMKV